MCVILIIRNEYVCNAVQLILFIELSEPTIREENPTKPPGPNDNNPDNNTQYFLSVEPSESTAREEDPTKPPGPNDNTTDNNPDNTNNLDPDENNPDGGICLDTHESVNYCKKMKKNGCKKRKLAKKNCRKSCNMCGKNLYFKRHN